MSVVPLGTKTEKVSSRPLSQCEKILGILILDVVRTARSYWSELLVVVEFVLYTTPGPHGFTPRDIDRRWSVGYPLEKDFYHF